MLKHSKLPLAINIFTKNYSLTVAINMSPVVKVKLIFNFFAANMLLKSICMLC